MPEFRLHLYADFSFVVDEPGKRDQQTVAEEYLDAMTDDDLVQYVRDGDIAVAAVERVAPETES